MADGKITFDTTIDNRQAEKDLKELEDQIDAASKKMEKEPDSGMAKAINEATDAAGGLQKALNEVGKPETSSAAATTRRLLISSRTTMGHPRRSTR